MVLAAIAVAAAGNVIGAVAVPDEPHRRRAVIGMNAAPAIYRALLRVGEGASGCSTAT